MTSYSLKSIFAPLPVTTRGQSNHLKTDPKNEKLLYCSGPAVIVRDLANPAVCYTYSEHPAEPTAACFAPSGYYICSGDSHGKVRVWDTTQETHICKYEGHVMNGPIKDICWSPDSKRILLGGAGRGTKTQCFGWDSGTTCGKLHNHSKDVNAVAHRGDRPFRAVTASEDFTVVFHSGVPYKYEFPIKEHTNFVNCVRFSPNGGNFCSVSSDKRALLFDGKTGEKIGELKDGDTAHNGGIMSVSYKGDSSQLITASADKTVRLWDIEASKCISTLEFGNDLGDQQLGCLWAGEFVLSVSLSGDINYLDLNANTITRTLKGHQKGIETMEVSGKNIYTSSYDGRICRYDAESSDAEYFKGMTGHKNKVVDTKVIDDKLVSVDITCSAYRSSRTDGQMGYAFSLPSRPGFLDVHPDCGIEVYACEQELIMYKNGKQVFTKNDLSYEPYGCAISPSGTVLAVGAKSQPKLFLYDIDGDTIVQRQEFDLSATPTEITFSPDGAFIGAATTGRHVIVLDVNNHYKAITHCWTSQSKTLTCAFSPDSRYLAVAGIDTNILVCDVTAPMSAMIKIVRAHPLGTINRVRWLDNNTVLSTGSDMQIRQHTISA